ncbi:hypothetical protein IWZ00DRAFT_290863 [Phyllosticta capitalensis]
MALIDAPAGNMLGSHASAEHECSWCARTYAHVARLRLTHTARGRCVMCLPAERSCVSKHSQTHHPHAMSSRAEIGWSGGFWAQIIFGWLSGWLAIGGFSSAEFNAPRQPGRCAVSLCCKRCCSLFRPSSGYKRLPTEKFLRLLDRQERKMGARRETFIHIRPSAVEPTRSY